MANSNPKPNTPSLLMIIQSYLVALRKQLVKLCKTDYHAFGMFNFHEFHEHYLEEHETLNNDEKELLLQAQQLVKNILFDHILQRVKDEAANVQNYSRQHKELSQYKAAQDYFLHNAGARIQKLPNDYIVLNNIFAPLKQDIVKEFSYPGVGRWADWLARNGKKDVTPKTLQLTPYAMFDEAFQRVYGELDKTKPARTEGAEPQPNPNEPKQRGSDPVEAIVNAAQKAPTGSAQFRNVGTYAFTWWVIKRDDLDKVRNQHYYPRHRGDFHPSHEELPNKEIARFLLGADENFGKFRGRVDGRYLGWMGLTKKGYLEGKEYGQLVPHFEVAEDEVVVLGAAHISRVDLLRLKFRGLNPWKMDWDTLVWKWDVWEGGSGGEGPGEVEVRVLVWDENGSGARKFLERETSESLDYEDVVRNPETYIVPRFDNLFNNKEAGLKGATVEIVGTEGSNLGNFNTDKEGRVTIRGLSPGQEVELLASKKNYQGVEGAPKAPLLHEINRVGEEVNKETNVARRYLTTPQKKEGPKRALLILKKRSKGVVDETKILVKPVVKSKNHSEPLKKPYGSFQKHTFDVGEGKELSFHITKEKQTQAVPPQKFYYYFFLAKKDGNYRVIDSTALASSSVTITFRERVSTYDNGFYNFIQRRCQNHYWSTGAGSETLAATFTPGERLALGTYRLYCLAVKSNVISDDVWYSIRSAILKDDPGDCSSLATTLWDFNFIEFRYREQNKQDRDAERVVKDLEKDRDRVEEAFTTPQSLQWMDEKQFDALVKFLKDIKKLARPGTKLQRAITALQTGGETSSSLPSAINNIMEQLRRDIPEEFGRTLQLLALLPYFMVFSYAQKKQKEVNVRNLLPESLPQELFDNLFDKERVHSILERLTDEDLKNSLKLFSTLCSVVAT